MTMCADKDKKTSSAYHVQDKEKTSITFEKEKKARDGYVCIYE